jgi:hypothetical protein
MIRILPVLLVSCSAMVAASCDFGRVVNVPTEPSEPYSPPPSLTPPPPLPTPPPIPAILLGEVVRFRITTDDYACIRGEGRCRSYNVTVPSNGEIVVVITPITPDDPLVETLEMYIVPGADYWQVGPGRQISATARVSAGRTYEIRMFMSRVPSLELELRTSLR